MDAALARKLRPLTDAVHAEGGAVSLQLGHAGGFTKHRRRGAPRGPSWALNPYGVMVGRPLIRPMTSRDLAAVVSDFACAAAGAVDAGFDAVELHLGHGYLLSQFLSPRSNRRRDGYGGTIAARLRLPLEVVRAARRAVGEDVPLVAKLNLTDGLRGGLGIDDAVLVAQALESEGIDALIPSGGMVNRNAMFLLRGGRPLRQMVAVEKSPLQKLALATLGPVLVRRVPFEPCFFLPLARRLRAAVRMPVALLGGIGSSADVATAMAEGFDLVCVGRALLADPDLVSRLAADAQSRCNRCNECIAEMDRPGGVRCTLPAQEASRQYA